MEIIKRYVPRTEFADYEDFSAHFKIDVPDDFDFARDVVDAYAAGEPEKCALLYCDDSGVEKRFTFADISRLSKQAASYFLSLGIQKGDRVLTLLRRRYEYWVCAVALHRIGAVVVPASIQLTTKDIAYRVESAKARMILAIDDEFVHAQVAPVPQKCPTLSHVVIVSDSDVSAFCADESAKCGGSCTYHDFHAESDGCGLYDSYSGLSNSDEMVIYFTSGTSGYPKMAIHNRTYPLGHIVTAKYMQRVQNNGLHLTQADSGWAKFGWGNIYGQWICGSAILGYDPVRFSTEHFMYVLEHYKPTSLCIPPTMYRFLLRDGLKHSHVASIKWFATAGEALSGEVNKQFKEISGQFIHEGFGQSEGTPITCGWEYLAIKPSSMGKPSPLYDVQLLNADGRFCEVGEEGEVVIMIHGEEPLGLLTCYYAQGETINPVVDGVYHTGDIAYKDEDGYFWYVGRNDDMIKCSGYRIGPFEIETVLNTHAAVKESAIIGAPDPVRGQIVCAVVVLHEGFTGSETLTKELQQYVKVNTAPYKYPRKIIYIDDLPKTTSGKIIRKELRKYTEAL